jgi:hypothetical protein
MVALDMANVIFITDVLVFQAGREELLIAL